MTQKRLNAADFVKAFQAAASIDEVAKLFGVSYRSVTSRALRLRLAGVKLKRMSKTNPKRRRAYIAKLNELIQ